VAVGTRFASLDEETRTRLIAAVAERVRGAVNGATDDLISVTLAVEAGAIRGAVSKQGAAEDGGQGARFEIPLEGSAEAQQ